MNGSRQGASRLVVSVHDVAPGSACESRTWVRELDRAGVPSSLLVVPGPWRGGSLAGDRRFAGWLAERVERGDEIIQHGWRHEAGPDGSGWRRMAERVLARGAGEFAALGEPAAAFRLRAGRTVLHSLGLPADAFTAPGWLHSPGTLSALRALGYRYTTTHTAVLDLRHGTHRPGLAFSHRAGGSGETLVARLLVPGTRAVMSFGGLVRIALHPDDLSRPGLVRATLRAIDTCLSLGAEPTTYGALLAVDARAAA